MSGNIYGRLPASGFNLGVCPSKGRASEDQIGESKQRQHLSVVFRQAAIARLAMLEQALHDMEAMLEFRTHAANGHDVRRTVNPGARPVQLRRIGKTCYVIYRAGVRIATGAPAPLTHLIVVLHHLVALLHLGKF